MKKTDRRIQQAREKLRKARMELIADRGYDGITIQGIVDRADVGPATFYLHYNNKDELFMSCHEAILGRFHIGLLQPLSREALLSPEIPAEMAWACQHLEEGRAFLCPFFKGKTANLSCGGFGSAALRKSKGICAQLFPK